MIPMTEERARELLRPWIRTEPGVVCGIDDLRSSEGSGELIDWAATPDPYNPELHLTSYLDGRFTPEQLEAIAWWMRNKVRRGT
jgi:hypothetical protein